MFGKQLLEMSSNPQFCDEFRRFIPIGRRLKERNKELLRQDKAVLDQG
jgi:hypothetical protein